MLKFWAFVFRRTGYTHSSLLAAEFENLLHSLDYIEQRFKDELVCEDDDKMSLENLVGIEIGMYQMKLGMTINHKHIDWDADSLSKKILIKIRRLLNV